MQQEARGGKRVAIKAGACVFRRLRYEGLTRYTSIRTGAQTVSAETIVIVQRFERNGSNLQLIPPYKLGYVEHGQMSLRLSLTPRDSSAGNAVTDPQSLVAHYFVGEGTDYGIGGLENPYEKETHGTVDMWSTEPWSDEVCWRYNLFWGLPIRRPLFDAENPIQEIRDGVPLFVNGWGQKTRDHLVRTMGYSKLEGDRLVDVLVRSSELEAVSVDESDAEFSHFVDVPEPPV